jgi:acyl-coenzyme A synthetase/AMP-(fatty) acid ligase
MTATAVATDEEVEFATSGHTGDPVVWRHGAGQLRYEAAVVADTLIGPVDHVINFAPQHHLYGHLFGDVLPRSRDIDVHQAWQDDVTTVPPLRPGARTLLVCLPSTWPLLRHMIPALRELPGVVALHSSAAPTETAGEVVAALRESGFRAETLLGSTETGAVAHRPVEPAGTRPPAWRLLPDVTLIPDRYADGISDGAHYLHVASPRIGRRHDMPAPPSSWRLTDIIRRLAPREFDHVGRASRLVKSNGRRVWLDEVEAAVRTAFPELDVACLPVIDPVRSEHYDLYLTYLTNRDAPEVRAALGRALPGVPGPRAIHPVTHIPRTHTGKVRITALRTLVSQSD